MINLQKNLFFFMFIILSYFSLSTQLNATQQTTFSAFLNGEKITADIPIHPEQVDSMYSYNIWKEETSALFTVSCKRAPEDQAKNVLNDLLNDLTCQGALYHEKLLDSKYGSWNGFPTLDIYARDLPGYSYVRFILTPEYLHSIEASYFSEEDFNVSEFEPFQNLLPPTHKTNPNNPHIQAYIGGKKCWHELLNTENCDLEYSVADNNRNLYFIECYDLLFLDVESPEEALKEHLEFYQVEHPHKLISYNINNKNGYLTLDINLLLGEDLVQIHFLGTQKQIIEVMTISKTGDEGLHNEIVKSLKVQ